MNKIPDISGIWELESSSIRRSNMFEIPDLNDIIVINENFCEMKQNNAFVSLKLPPNEVRPLPGYLLGTLTKTFECSSCKNFSWTLTFSDSDDNGVFTLLISEVACDGTILEWQGHYTEPGFVGMSSTQFQTAGIVKLKRILISK